LTFLASQDLRGRLTSNRTFSHLSWHYGIPRELIFSQRDSDRRSSREEDQRIAANAFEAHWGALFASGDASLMLDWLDQFLKPIVIPALDHIEKTIDTEYDGTSGVPPEAPAPRNRRSGARCARTYKMSG
jgi:dsRNA-specific ribonuclease